MLRGELLDDPHVEIDTAVRAGVAGGADDHGDAELPRREQHVLKVVRLPCEWAGRCVGPERHRADVIAPGVGGDIVRSRRDTDLEAPDAKRRKSEVAVRTTNA